MFEVSVGKENPLSVSSKDGKWWVDGQEVNAGISPVGEGMFHLLIDGRSVEVAVVETFPEEKAVMLMVNGKKVRVSVMSELDQLLRKMGLEKAGTGKSMEIKAPMPGLIHSIKVNEGEEVKKGDTVLILEAMKMENIIKAANDGKVKKIHAKEKASVEKGAVLVTFE